LQRRFEDARQVLQSRLAIDEPPCIESNRGDAAQEFQRKLLGGRQFLLYVFPAEVALFEVCQLGGKSHGIIESANLIDKAMVQRYFARPDLALGNAIDVRLIQPAILCNLADEDDVATVNNKLEYCLGFV
jgi:hypothetical protein